MKQFHRMNVFGGAMLALSLLSVSHLALGQESTWIATWTASPEAADSDPSEPLLNLNDQTVREHLRVSLGGRQIRVRLSNEYGSAPLLVGQISVGIAQGPASVVSGSIRPVTFGGMTSILIPPGASALSDPVDMPIKDGTEISISLYFPKRISSVTCHALALRRAVVSTPGDHTQDVTIHDGTESQSSVLLSSVLVPALSNRRVIVAFGDSIVDGDGSTIEMDHEWPSDLFRRLEKKSNGARFAVVNEGIAGNRLLGDGPVASLGVSALARFDRDALSVPGVTDIICLKESMTLVFREPSWEISF